MEKQIGRPLKEIVKQDRDDVDQFLDLLESHNINPFLSWEVQRNDLAKDPRYLALSSNSARAAAFNQWKQKAGTAESEDETSKFVQFIHSQFKPGMLYAIFKRKFRTNPAYLQCRIPEKEKESLFQEYKLIYQIENSEDKLAYIESKPLFSMLKPQT